MGLVGKGFQECIPLCICNLKPVFCYSVFACLLLVTYF